MSNALAVSTNKYVWKLFNVYAGFNIDKLSVQDRWQIKKTILIEVQLFLATAFKKENRCLAWDKRVPDIKWCFCPNFLWFCWLSLVAFGDFISQKRDESPVGVGISCSAAEKNLTSPSLWTRYVLQNIVFISLVGRSETGKSQLFYNWLKIGNFQTKFDKIYFSNQYSQPLYNVMQKEFVSRRKLWN